MFRLFRCAAALLLLAAAASAAQPEKVIRLRNERITTPAPSAEKHRPDNAASSGLFLIQFESAPTSAQRSQLAALGVDLLSYVPDDAFIVSLENVPRGPLRALPFVRWVGPFKPEHKLHDKLSSAAEAAQKAKPGSDVEVSVLFAPRARANQSASARSHFSRINGETELREGTILRGAIPAARLQQLGESPAVLWIEPAPQMRLFDEIATKITAGHDGNAGTPAAVHQLGYTGTGVTVAVADSGLDSGDTNAMHPDIAGRVTALFHYGASLSDAADEHSHGTHCAGIIAGNGATGETDENGFLYGLGVAPGSSLIGQRLFDGLGGYTYPNTSFEPLTRDAKLAGADIGSNSWGDDTQGRYDLSAMEFDALVRDSVGDVYAAGDQPYILEFSAGNAGPGDRTIGSPAVAKNVIATGAAQNDRPDLLIYGDGPDAMADFSSRGPCEDGRIKPDVTAPGTWIASLRSVYADDNNAWGEISPYYMYQGGTSQAGPHVSGAAAVFVQYWRQSHTNETPSPAMVKAALINSATDMDETAIGTSSPFGDLFDDPIDVAFPQDAHPIPNMDEGWGRVTLTNLIGSTKDYEFVDQSVLLTNDQYYEVRVLIGSADEPVKITLAYTDVPGSPVTVPALVNDLDLEVFAPDGRVYRGNRFFAGESIPNPATFDTINNVEAVHLLDPVAGEYTVRIHGRNVVMDARRDTGAIDQDFALVVSGKFAPPGTGIVTFDRRVYTAPSTINLRLVDYNLAGQPTASVALTSSTETIAENLTLSASGTHGLFTGTVATASGAAASDGVLQIQHGDTITATYHDAAPPMQRTFTAQADLLPPVISGVSVLDRFGRAQIHWDTDEHASAVLIYGTTTALGSARTNSLLATNHVAIADNQVSGETNYFMLVCADEAGNITTNDNGGMLFNYVVPFAAPVLVVDGYYSDLLDPPPPVSNYTDALDQLGMSYDVWDVETLGPPSAADLRTYRAVLWRIAEFSTEHATGLKAEEQNAIRNYLASGGSVLIASMELISRLGPNTSFVRDVLHVAGFTEDAATTAVEGVPNDQIGNGLSLELDYTDYTYLGVLELNGSDTITPGAGAEGILTDYDTGEFAGLRYPRVGVDSPGRIVFLGFPLDTVPLDTPAPDNRSTLLGRILLFLAPGLNGQGSIAFNQSVYAVPSEVTVEVADSDLEGLGQISINVNSDTQTNGLTLNLQETQRRGVFQGSFALVQSSAGGLLPELIANPGDEIHASYFDASSNITIVASAPVENTPPIISGVTAEASYVEAIVYWQTDELADSKVEFGESTLLGRTAVSSTPTDFHAVTLPQLEPDRTYYYRVVSRDRAGNRAVDDNNGALFTFSTLAPIHPPWSDNLEGSITNWTVYTVDESESGWEHGAPGALSLPAHSPTNCWGTNLKSNYASAVESYLISPAILLTGGNTFTLRFWHAYDFTPKSEYDIFEAGELLLVTNNALNPIALDVYVDESGGWQEVEIDLSAYSGQLVYLAWHYFLFSLDSMPRLGWLVDDVSVTVTNITPGTIVISNNLWQTLYSLEGPSPRVGNGLGATFTNAAPGTYNIVFGSVPYYQKPANQTNTLASGGTIAFTGNYTFTDANNNGISDDWELAHFSEVSTNRTSSTDTDGDGMSDYAESVAGTDPNGEESKLEIAVTRETGGALRFDWPAMGGRGYRLHGGTNFTSWSPLSPWLRGSNSFTLQGATSSGPNLFRLEVAP